MKEREREERERERSGGGRVGIGRAEGKGKRGEGEGGEEGGGMRSESLQWRGEVVMEWLQLWREKVVMYVLHLLMPPPQSPRMRSAQLRLIRVPRMLCVLLRGSKAPAQTPAPTTP